MVAITNILIFIVIIMLWNKIQIIKVFNKKLNSCKKYEKNS